LYEIKQYLADYPEVVRFNIEGPTIGSPPGRSDPVVGVMNFGTRKEMLYSSSQFTILFHHFIESLKTVRVLAVAGYSFRDDRINRIIEQALVARKGDLLMIVVNRSGWTLADNMPTLHELNSAGLVKMIPETLTRALATKRLAGC
jgi:hypothetical protein